MIVSHEFLLQCKTEAFLKFNSCFSTEFVLFKNTYVSKKTAVTLTRCVQIYLNDTPSKARRYTESK